MARNTAVIIAVAFAIAGCAGTETAPEPVPSPTQSTSIAPEPTETASPEQTSPDQDWADALAAIPGRASIDAQLITNVEGFERIVSGSGIVESSNGNGDITWSDDLATTREVITDEGHFLELDGTWFELGADSAVPTKVGFTPLEGLDSADSIVRTGSENVLGVETTRLNAELDPQIGNRTMGFSGEELTVVDEATNATLIATIWIDDEGRIVRVLREYSALSPDGDPINATSLYLLGDFTESAPIDVPETAEAIPAPV